MSLFRFRIGAGGVYFGVCLSFILQAYIYCVSDDIALEPKPTRNSSRLWLERIKAFINHREFYFLGIA